MYPAHQKNRVQKLELCLLTPLFDITPVQVAKPQVEVAVAAPAVTPTVTVKEVPQAVPVPEPAPETPEPEKNLPTLT